MNQIQVLTIVVDSIMILVKDVSGMVISGWSEIGGFPPPFFSLLFYNQMITQPTPSIGSPRIAARRPVLRGSWTILRFHSEAAKQGFQSQMPSYYLLKVSKSSSGKISLKIISTSFSIFFRPVELNRSWVDFCQIVKLKVFSTGIDRRRKSPKYP